MVRLRQLAAEVHSPDELRSGFLLTMPYLQDFDAFQEFQDGKLERLYQRNLGNTAQQNVTGARFYRDAGVGAYWQINLFRAMTRYFLASVFERNPIALDASPEVQKRWEAQSRPLIREARRAVEWRLSKGHGVLSVEHRVGDLMIPRAIDPRGYLPIVDRVDRDLVIGTILFRLWWEGPRQSHNNHPNRITTDVFVTPEEAALSDGRFGELNERTNWVYAGSQGQGTIASPLAITFGDEQSRAQNVRLEKVWVFGDGDSTYASMERDVYEILLNLTHARTAMTRDVRSVRIDPPLQGGQEGGVLDLLNPTFRISDTLQGSGLQSVLGYVEPPGPTLSEAFMRLAEAGFSNLAYSANVPPEAFGDNYMANEPAEALTKLQQVFKTAVIDARDDLARILSEMYLVLYGEEIAVGWVLEPFANTKEEQDRYVTFYEKKLASREFTQKQLNLPVEEIDDGEVQRDTDNEREGLDGRDGGESEGTGDGTVQ